MFDLLFGAIDLVTCAISTVTDVLVDEAEASLGQAGVIAHNTVSLDKPLALCSGYTNVEPEAKAESKDEAKAESKDIKAMSYDDAINAFKNDVSENLTSFMNLNLSDEDKKKFLNEVKTLVDEVAGEHPAKKSA